MSLNRLTTNGSAEQKSVLALRFLRAAKQESMYACFSSDFNLRHCLTVNGGCLFVIGNKVYAVCYESYDNECVHIGINESLHIYNKLQHKKNSLFLSFFSIFYYINKT